jgi:ribonuclease BN (tRNA processing enzyme)
MYTGDSGPTADIADLASGADLLLAEATYVDRVPSDSVQHLGSARAAGQHAAAARTAHLVLTHLSPGTNPMAAQRAAARAFAGPIDVARGGLVVDLA